MLEIVDNILNAQRQRSVRSDPHIHVFDEMRGDHGMLPIEVDSESFKRDYLMYWFVMPDERQRRARHLLHDPPAQTHILDPKNFPKTMSMLFKIQKDIDEGKHTYGFGIIKRAEDLGEPAFLQKMRNMRRANADRMAGVERWQKRVAHHVQHVIRDAEEDREHQKYAEARIPTEKPIRVPTGAAKIRPLRGGEGQWEDGDASTVNESTQVGAWQDSGTVTKRGTWTE